MNSVLGCRGRFSSFESSEVYNVDASFRGRVSMIVGRVHCFKTLKTSNIKRTRVRMRIIEIEMFDMKGGEKHIVSG